MGDETESWRRWLARHGPALVLFARQWTQNAADAEDAVQEGFVRFWERRSRARGVGYLYACVRTAAIDLARARASRRRRLDAIAGAAPLASAFAPEQADLAAEAEAALAMLRPEQREVVVMKIWGELTFAEIAQALRISPNTAASRYRYAMRKLQAVLTPEVKRG